MSRTKKLSLYSISEEQVGEKCLKLGEAIRRGQEEHVFDIIENNSDIIVDDLLCKLGIKFELDLRKEINFDQREKCKMFVTPFHLAIISQEPRIVECMIEAIKKHSKAPIASLTNLLSMKTEVEFAKGFPDTYCSDDRSLDGINAFHLAARFHGQSFLIIIRFLRDNNILETLQPFLQIPDVHMSKTLLHTAAKSPSPLSLKILLLLNVLNINAKDKRGFTALHIASKEGNDMNCQLLLDYGADANAHGNDGNKTTPLHLAKTKHIVNMLLKYGANPFAKQVESNASVIDKLLDTNPQAVEEIVNLGILTNGQELDSPDLQIIFNFEMFFHEGAKNDMLENDDNQSNLQYVDEMAAISKIAESSHTDLMKTPLVEAFLHLKWQSVDSLFYCNVAAYTAFLLMLTIMTALLGHMSNCVKVDNVLTGYNINCTEYNKQPDLIFWNVVERHINDQKSSHHNTLGQLFTMSFNLASIGLIFLIIRELIQLVTNPKRYIKSFENFVEALIITLTIATMILINYDKDIAIHTGTWAVFLGWWEMALLLGRFPVFGVYIYLFVGVLKTLIVFFMVYLPVLIAFALTFYLLLPSEKTPNPFMDPGTSLLTVLAMMIGELEYDNHFLRSHSSKEFGIGSAQLAFILFVLMVNIVVANLLIGLTVSKTDELFKQAGIHRLQKTANQINAIESVIGTESWQQCFICHIFPYFSKRTKIFSYFLSILTEDNQSSEFSEGVPSPWKICVMPHSKRYSKGRKIINASSGTSSFSFKGHYPVYLYNDVEGLIKEKLKFTLPSWVILHSLCLLEQQKKIKDTEEAKAMSSEKTNLETLEVLLGNSAENPKKGFTPERRKVSTEPNLKDISEEEIQVNKKVVLQTLENKLTALQSDLQELKNVIHTAMKGLDVSPDP